MLWANRAALARSGMRAEDLLGRSCFDLSPREGDEYFQEDLQVIESRQPMYGIVHRMRRVNGELLWLVTDKIPCFGPDGSVTGIVAITRDLPDGVTRTSPRPAHTAHLRLPRELMHADAGGSATFVSDGLCRMFGLERDAALGGGWQSVVYPEDLSALREAWESAARDRGPVLHARFRILQGRGASPVKLELRGVPEHDDAGTVTGFLASVSHDLSSPGDAAADDAQRRLFDAMATAAPVGMFVADTLGNVSYVNDRWCRIYGIEGGKSLAHGWIETIHPDDRQRMLEGARRSTIEKRPHSEEFRQWCRDGTERWVLARSVPLLDSAGEVTVHVGTVTDITSRKRAEEEIRRLNHDLEVRVGEPTVELRAAIKELEAFCYAVSHDLRAPLRTLDGFSHALLEEFGDKVDLTAVDWLKRLRRGSQRMGRLIDDLLALSRLGRGTMRRQEVDLSGVAADVVEELRHIDRDRCVDVEIEAGATSMGDPDLLRVVMQNLIGNAWKFTATAEGAHIRFGQDIDEGGQPAFYVSDNGVGFDMTYGDKLFGMFQRLHHPFEFEGTGVGPANVCRIVQRHGEQVWPQGQPGAGATFYFTV